MACIGNHRLFPSPASPALEGGLALEAGSPPAGPPPALVELAAVEPALAAGPAQDPAVA